jgi:hypothetical protein
MKHCVFVRSEKACDDLINFAIGTNPLNIDPDLSIISEGIKNKLVGVGQIETEHSAAAYFRQCWFSVGCVTESQSVWLDIQVVANQHPEQPASNDEAVPVSVKAVMVSSASLVRRECLRQRLKTAYHLVERNAPNMDVTVRQCNTSRRSIWQAIDD